MPGGLVGTALPEMRSRQPQMALGAAVFGLQHPLIERRCLFMVAGGEQFARAPDRFFEGRGVHGTPSGVAPGRRKDLEYPHKVSGLAERKTSMKRSGIPSGRETGG